MKVLSVRMCGLLAAVLFLRLGAAGVAHAQAPGTSDPGFTASSGNVVFAVGQPSGRIIDNLRSSSELSAEPSAPMRLNADGTLDPGFCPAANTGSVLAVQPDGKLLTVVHGYGLDYYFPTDQLFRLNPDGSLDSSFTGYQTGDGINQQGFTINKVTVQPDGKILVGGYLYMRGFTIPLALIRLNADGTFDTGFNTSSFTGPFGSDGLDFIVASRRRVW